jgi:hypothetical protein
MKFFGFDHHNNHIRVTSSYFTNIGEGKEEGQREKRKRD